MSKEVLPTPAPGSPEWQAEYDKAEAELSEKGYKKAPRTQATTVDDDEEEGKEAESTPPEKSEAPEPKPEPSEVERLTALLEAEKQKTQGIKQWADTQVSKAAKKADEALKRAKELEAQKPPPAVLTDIEGFEEGVKHILSKEAPPPEEEDEDDQPPPEEVRKVWNKVVLGVIPDLKEAAAADPELARKLTEKRQAVGDEVWRDPLEAVRLMTQVISDHKVEKATLKLQKKVVNDPLRVPGGSGGKVTDTSKKEESYDDIAALSHADFQKRLKRIKGS